MKLYTIGFTQKSAQEFFEALKQAGVRKLLDIRLNNTSQLSGFAKRDDLGYFAQSLCGASYHHLPDLAPTQELLDSMKKHKGSWEDYEPRFQALMRERRAIERLKRPFFEEEPCCLLCSEASPKHCHRRLVAEALQRKWKDLELIHL
ncbi:DUF488 family protein [Hyalangium rubrum]|uniref:DUF488 domain-containing protein n=1 Tax=Hyalangium rubrum TaxID=3103134 RepID=A0ABU5GZF9_9BACT|nr:DUF488 domain-containing protein [Hyalangium sp. s54d21]MDY7226267.1 DUF488 domain-containing protein [Hyalangium sp. s54d21]